MTSTIPKREIAVLPFRGIVTAQTGVKTLLVDGPASSNGPEVLRLQSPHGLSAHLSGTASGTSRRSFHTTEVPNPVLFVADGCQQSFRTSVQRMLQFFEGRLRGITTASFWIARRSRRSPTPGGGGPHGRGDAYVTKFNKVRRDSVLNQCSVSRTRDLSGGRRGQRHRLP